MSINIALNRMVILPWKLDGSGLSTAVILATEAPGVDLRLSLNFWRVQPRSSVAHSFALTRALCRRISFDLTDFVAMEPIIGNERLSPFTLPRHRPIADIAPAEHAVPADAIDAPVGSGLRIADA